MPVYSQTMDAKVAELQEELLETRGLAAQQLATSLQQQVALEGQVEHLTAQVGCLPVQDGLRLTDWVQSLYLTVSFPKLRSVAEAATRSGLRAHCLF